MPDQGPEDVKSERLQRLQGLLSQQQKAFNASCVGRRFEVLFERDGRREGQLVGRSPYLQAVHANGARDLLGRVLEVEISSAGPNSLEADILEASNSASVAAPVAGA